MPIVLSELYTCLYCGQPGEEKEHVFANSAIKKLDAWGIMQFEFLVGTCYRCNRIKGARIFSTVGAAIDFVQHALKRTGECQLPNLPDELRSVSIVGRGFLDDRLSSAAQSTKTLTGFEYSGMLQELIMRTLARRCSLCGMTFTALLTSTRLYCYGRCETRAKHYRVILEQTHWKLEEFLEMGYHMQTVILDDIASKWRRRAQ